MEKLEIRNGKFKNLSFKEQIVHLQSVANRAKILWGYPEDANATLLNFTENATFKLTSKGMPTMVMRVHRLDFATIKSIKTELTWLEYLSDNTNLSLDTPQPSLKNNYVEEIVTSELEEKRFVDCFSYQKGKSPVDSSDGNDDIGNLIAKIEKIPLKITVPVFRFAAVLQQATCKWKKTGLSIEDRALYQKIGKIAATMHKLAIQWKEPSFYDRMEWDFKGTFGKEWNNFYGVSYRNRDWLSESDIESIDASVELMKKRLEIYGKGKERYGMIHSDLRTANLLQDGNQLTVLDFDDCGKGWYMYDIASSVALMEHRGDLSEVVNELLKGYESIRTIENEDRREVWTFIMMRRIGMLQSLLYRLGAVIPGSGEAAELTPEVLAFFAKGTAILSRKYLMEFSQEENINSTRDYQTIN